MSTGVSKSLSITANMSVDELKKMVENDYGLISDKIKKIDGYDDLNFHVMPPVGVSDNAINIDSWPHGFIIKIINRRNSKNVEFFNEYINVLLHLNAEKFSCPCPVMNKRGKYLGCWTSSARDKQSDEDKFDDPDRHLVLVLSYLPGQILEKFPCNDRIEFLLGHNLSRLHALLKVIISKVLEANEQCGQFAAIASFRLHLSVFAISQSFSDKKALERPDYQWSLLAAPKVAENLISLINEERKRDLINRIIDSFQKILLLNANQLAKGTIHGDLNLANVLVQKNENEQLEITAIIDFTDMHNSYYFFDIAMAACYISLHDVHRCEDGIALLLLGYGGKFTDFDLNIIKICICTRLCQSILNGLESLLSNPDNDHVKNGAPLKYGWTLLEKLDEMTTEQFIIAIRQKMEKYGNRFSK